MKITKRFVTAVFTAAIMMPLISCSHPMGETPGDTMPSSSAAEDMLAMDYLKIEPATVAGMSDDQILAEIRVQIEAAIGYLALDPDSGRTTIRLRRFLDRLDNDSAFRELILGKLRGATPTQTTPPPTPTPVPAPPSTAPSMAGPPLSFDDVRFANATSSGRLTLGDGATFMDKSIVDTGGESSITCSGSCTLRRVRVNSRECIRLTRKDMIIEDSYLEATGQGDDHADVIQAYSPGSTGTLTLRNTTIRAHETAATAGVFIADNWGPNLIDFENVVFWGGPYGLRLHADGYKNAHLKMKNVCFVGPFGYGRFLISLGSGGNTSTGWYIDEWTNVNDCVIQNGKLVIVSPIPKPN